MISFSQLFWIRYQAAATEHFGFRNPVKKEDASQAIATTVWAMKSTIEWIAAAAATGAFYNHSPSAFRQKDPLRLTQTDAHPQFWLTTFCGRCPPFLNDPISRLAATWIESQ
jgi:hypothetical protein